MSMMLADAHQLAFPVMLALAAIPLAITKDRQPRVADERSSVPLQRQY